jgi:hypothetical protein
VRPLFRRAGSGGLREVNRDSVEPGRQRLLPADGSGLAGQHEEGSLKSILGAVGIVEHLPADREHEGAMPLQECGEGAFIPLIDKLLKELAVALVRPHLGTLEVAKKLQHARYRLACHTLSPTPLLIRR